MNQDRQPKLAELAKEVPAREAWRVFGIMSELVEATERLVGIHPAVSVFGSARVKQGTPYYELAEETARRLSRRHRRRPRPDGGREPGRVRRRRARCGPQHRPRGRAAREPLPAHQP